MTTLPAPEVSVDVVPSPDGTTQGVNITVKRDNQSYDGKADTRTWIGEGKTVGEAVKGAVEKMIGDRRTGEYLP